jgi:hypothetical protein
MKPLTASARARRIRTILDARFSLSAFQDWKDNDPQWWHSKRNDMGRGLYGEALREQRRLEAATDEELAAEHAAIASPAPGSRRPMSANPDAGVCE